MSTKSNVTAIRRRTIVGLAGMTAFASARKVAWSASQGSSSMIKRASLLSRKPGISHEEFVKHWVEIHAPLAYACPGISRYTLTIIKSSSTRKDVPALDVTIDGIAELWFKDKAALDLYQASPATKRLRDDGATFIGREIDFTTEERVIIPR
jgi:uncharacterized protein (TIGR02118 family)